MNNLSVIVPFYNEQNTLSKSIERLLKQDIFNKIILSDDNSSDNSPEIAQYYASKHNHVEYIRSSSNLGKGSAINVAKNYIETTHVVIHDADLEYFPEDIVEMFKTADEHLDAMILGSRFIGKKSRKNIYIRTFLANKIMSFFFSVVHVKWITDVATCYKLMPTKFLKEIEIKEKGFSIEIELLSKYLKHYNNIKEVPISYEGRTYEDGKKIKPLDGFLYIVNTLKYRLSKS